MDPANQNDYSRAVLAIQTPVSVTLAQKKVSLEQIVNLVPGSMLTFDAGRHRCRPTLGTMYLRHNSRYTPWRGESFKKAGQQGVYRLHDPLSRVENRDCWRTRGFWRRGRADNECRQHTLIG